MKVSRLSDIITISYDIVIISDRKIENAKYYRSNCGFSGVGN